MPSAPGSTNFSVRRRSTASNASPLSPSSDGLPGSGSGSGSSSGCFRPGAPEPESLIVSLGSVAQICSPVAGLW